MAGVTTAFDSRYSAPSLEMEATFAVPRRKLSHLKALEAESIYIPREAVAEFAHPVMLYSIGKDSSMMLRLARKAFFPGRIPFPLLHIDTSYKFPEMIEFRDRYAKEIEAELIVHDCDLRRLATGVVWGALNHHQVHGRDRKACFGHFPGGAAMNVSSIHANSSCPLSCSC
jgi:3'-phosphoadenosine 5'-phosphosulfate sulfotransferase (PAPS reductase)/FAD synthetase